MAGTKKRRTGSWEEETFLNVESAHRPTSASRKPSPGKSSTRRPPSGSTGRTDRPFWEELPSRQPARAPGPVRGQAPPRPGGRPPQGSGPGTPRGSSQGRRPPPGSRRPPPSSRKPPPPKRKPMNPKAKVLFTVSILLVMAVATVLLCVFLVFKVKQVVVTGESIYAPQDLIATCDFQMGDTLYFVPTKEKEALLKEKFPYLESVEIRRNMPDTLEIVISPAQVVASVETGGSFLSISDKGRILESGGTAKENVLQVVGLTPKDTTVGAQLMVEDGSVVDAFTAITDTLVTLDATAQFTKLDLSDLLNIRLTYQNRVEFLLGGATALPYKVEFGIEVVRDEAKIGFQEEGILDLSLAEDVKRASFTPGSAAGPSSPAASPGPSPTPNPDGTTPTEEVTSGTENQEGEQDTGDTENTENTEGTENTENTEETTGGRDAGIPDAPFTG